MHLRSCSLNIVSLSDMIEGSYRSWDLYTTGQLVDGLQQKKKENLFLLNGNGIMSSFLGRQSYRSTLYIYIKYIWFGLVWFYGISTIVGYLKPNPLYTYIWNIMIHEHILLIKF